MGQVLFNILPVSPSEGLPLKLYKPKDVVDSTDSQCAYSGLVEIG